jgi:hypothetical protein
MPSARSRLGTWAALAGAIGGAHCSVAATPTEHATGPRDVDAGTAAIVDPNDPDAESGPPAVADGGAADVASPGAASAQPCAALPLCDGFESDAVGAPPSASVWSIAQPDCTGTGTLAIDDSQAHSGTRSVRVNGGGGYCDHVFIDDTAVMPTLGPQVYARFFVRLDAALGQGHVSFLAMKDAADKGDDMRMGGQDAIVVYNRQSDDATLPTLSPTGIGDSVALIAGAWTCIELHVDESAGTIDTWVDGAEVAGLVENGTAAPDISTQWLSRAWKPMLTDFRLGWESYSGQTMTLWFDDVALASHRIGCD